LQTALLALALWLAPAALSAQKPQVTDSATARENAVKRQRQGAGLRVGTWQTTGLTTVTGASYSTLPALEGYWQKGLDEHVAIETSGGFWGRTQRDSNGRVSSFAVPMLTAIKLYPATTVADQLEPFISAGGGFTIGVDDETGATGGLLPGGGSSGTALIIGLGLKGGAGLEYHAGRAFGLQAGVAYQWIHFLNPVGGNSDYKGPLIYGGLTYRFQY
jgi:hypothetical protein